jgi:hypothetical protein
MKNKYSISVQISEFILALAVVVGTVARAAADPLLTSWFTSYSGKYARIYTSDGAKEAGTAVTTWTNGSLEQSLPAYDGVQEVYSSSDWVYIRSTGLGSHVMGPWYLDAAHTEAFPNYPVNQQALFRIPRNPTAGTNTVNGGGAIGYFVDGVSMFNSWDAFYWNGTEDTSGGAGNGAAWNRDAYVNEGVTFDPANAHQPGSGQYHYHANPPALRYFLGDHVNYNAASDTYSESTNTPTQHSPILGWVADGHPIYGPYGFSTATNAASGLRRMISGYVPRNGLSGTDNLSTNGAARTAIPAWAQRFYYLAAAQSGPAVSTSYPFGRYMEDNDFLGDLTNASTGQAYAQGTDFDLDQYNGRYCVTPDYPNGTYAYFVAISSNGTPLFPYNIGRAYDGSPTGGSLTTVPETVTTNFEGGPNLAPLLNVPSVNNTTVFLTWSATEGGTYVVDSSANLQTWVSNVTHVTAVQNTGAFTNTSASNQWFYRVVRTALASYDPVSGTSGGGGSGATISMSPSSGSRGASFTVTATLSASATPPVPPMSGAPVASFTVGTNSVTGATYTYNNATDSGTVTGTLTIPTGAATGSQTVTITFSPPPGQTQGPSYTQTVAFTIQ